jgi:hypothetical protein
MRNKAGTLLDERAGDCKNRSAAAAAAAVPDEAVKGVPGVTESLGMSNDILDGGSGTTGVGTYLYLAPEAKLRPHKQTGSRHE